MDNRELAAKIGQIIEPLEGIETSLEMLVDREIEDRERAEAQKVARALVQRAPRAVAGWPWTPDTVSQGFLAGRWLRRDGNVYGGAALRGVSGPNSPVAGGQDNQAKIDVPSGAPRVE